MKISVILPTYNEKENIIPLIREIEESLSNHKLNYEIIVVDDNSPDGTGKTVEEFAKKNKKVKCLIRYDIRGLATAIKEGIQRTSRELIVVMDTDFSHTPSTIPKMFDVLEDNDIIVASRYIRQGAMDAPIHKYFGSFMLNKAIDIILGLKVKDSTGGFLLFKRKSISNLNLDKIFKGYGEFCFRLLYLLRKNKKKIKEVPFRYGLRRYGETKTKLLKVGFSYLYQAFKARFEL